MEIIHLFAVFIAHSANGSRAGRFVISAPLVDHSALALQAIKGNGKKKNNKHKKNSLAISSVCR